MTTPSISVRNLSVRYPVVVTGAQQSMLAGMANMISAGRIGKGAGNLQYVDALRGVSAEIANGERVGLIGRNGAGKSTLLKTLAGLLPASRGKVEVVGSRANILSIGSGLDPDLSGFENIERVCRLMQVPKSHWAEIKDDVAEFTELDKFLSLPVRTYSSGMSVRLAFAVVTAYPRDILVIDEVIGAGDMFFVKKALDRIEAYAHQAKILILATHSIGYLESFCNRAIHLESGRIMNDGQVHDVWNAYHAQGGG